MAGSSCAAVVLAGSVSPTPAAGAQAPLFVRSAVALTSGSSEQASPLGDGTALFMGGTGIPQPNALYMDAQNALYLAPLGFDGDLESLFYPANTSSTSQARGQQILNSTILQYLNNGEANPAHPLVISGYSQSAAISSAVMRQLDGQNVPSSDVHFVLFGNPNNPVGGMTVQTSILYPQYLQDYVATPNNLYHADVYTLEYDGVGDFPKYPLNLLADLNAALGFFYQHPTYFSLTAEQLDAAVQLPTSTADSMVNYYMIPADSLPLLDPLRLIPILGQPLYDLLEPATRVLVNLGYGNIDHGWATGYADVVTSSGLFPEVNIVDVLGALGNGVVQGVGDFFDALKDPATYQIIPLVENPSLANVLDAAYLFGFLDTPQPTLPEALQGLVEVILAFSAMT